MRRRLWISLVVILLLGILTAAGSFTWHFYYLFGNSHKLFQLRHNYFSHLEFHLGEWSFQPGESIEVFISASGKDSVQIQVYDILYRDTLVQEQKVKAFFQPASDSVSVAGTHWKPTCRIPVPENAPSGWYVMEVRNREFVRYTSVFIRPRKNQVSNRVAILFSTNTWNAYNHWGGQSLYSRNYTPTVSFNRPQLLADPFIENTYPLHQLYFQAANKDRYLAQLLDSAGIGFDAYSMSDLERSSVPLDQYDALFICTHSEYWSWNMQHHLNACLDSGVSLISLAGNICVYKTTFSEDQRGITVYKKAGNVWFDIDTANIRPFGTMFEYGGFQTYSPYKVRVDTSWVLENTGLGRGDLFGEKSDTYDYTCMYDKWWENIRNLTARGKMGAAAGIEFGKVYPGTPSNWVTIASGMNGPEAGCGEIYPDPGMMWADGAGADMGYYEHPGGGIVFNASSMAVTGAIPYDPALRQMILNVLGRAGVVGSEER